VLTQPKLEALQRAKDRLDPLALYPEPVRIDGVQIRIAPWLFRIPGRPSTFSSDRRAYRANRYEAEAIRAAARVPRRAVG
jgi:hypothetical protein